MAQIQFHIYPIAFDSTSSGFRQPNNSAQDLCGFPIIDE